MNDATCLEVHHGDDAVETRAAEEFLHSPHPGLEMRVIGVFRAGSMGREGGQRPGAHEVGGQDTVSSR